MVKVNPFEKVEVPKLLVGDRVYFSTDERPYTVKAIEEGRFAICTKPFNLQRTVLYTIIDFQEGVRGPNDLVFNMYDYAIQEEIDECLKDLLSGEVGVSRRRSVGLDIVKVAGGRRSLKAPAD